MSPPRPSSSIDLEHFTEALETYERSGDRCHGDYGRRCVTNLWLSRLIACAASRWPTPAPEKVQHWLDAYSRDPSSDRCQTCMAAAALSFSAERYPELTGPEHRVCGVARALARMRAVSSSRLDLYELYENDGLLEEDVRTLARDVVTDGPALSFGT